MVYSTVERPAGFEIDTFADERKVIEAKRIQHTRIKRSCGLKTAIRNEVVLVVIKRTLSSVERRRKRVGGRCAKSTINCGAVFRTLKSKLHRLTICGTFDTHGTVLVPVVGNIRQFALQARSRLSIRAGNIRSHVDGCGKIADLRDLKIRYFRAALYLLRREIHSPGSFQASLLLSDCEAPDLKQVVRQIRLCFDGIDVCATDIEPIG
jgi:hypothetical protein